MEDETEDFCSIHNGLQDAVQELQGAMAMLDMLRERIARPQSGNKNVELLLWKGKNIRIKMDGNRNHGRAHVHIDYNKMRHVASYAVDDGSRLAGSSSHDSAIQPWIERHRQLLMDVWHDLRETGAPDATVVAQLEGSAL